MNKVFNVYFALFLILCSNIYSYSQSIKHRIQPFEKNPFYWKYKNKPVILIGGTDDDNLFNQPDELHPKGLASHLDLLISVGGNYIRNTMSSRDSGSVWPFIKTANGKYDLNQWNPEYWNRFDRLLELAEARDIIVQVEIWDPWDYFRDSEEGGWSKQPFNPLNNINYTPDESGLQSNIDYVPQEQPTGHNFFHTVPELENNQVVLKFQESFVMKILQHSLPYPNVLYCVSNETGEPIEWSLYWAKFIHNKAKETGLPAEVTEMRRANNINSGDHRLLQDRPDVFTFLDISQNNGGSGWEKPEERHWIPVMELREYISDKPRPMNNTKIYGSKTGGRGGEEQAIQKFWRNIFAGCSSARFHRPASGIGLSKIAQSHIKSMSILINNFHIYSCIPHNDLLKGRDSNEAYCIAEPGKQYAVYFTDGGQVNLEIPGNTKWKLIWLNIDNCKWENKNNITTSNNHIELKTPGPGHWVALVIR